MSSPRPPAFRPAPHRLLALVAALAVGAALALAQASPKAAQSLAAAAACADSREPEQANFKTTGTEEEDVALPDATCLAQHLSTAAERSHAAPKMAATTPARREPPRDLATLADHSPKLSALGTHVRRLL